MAATAKRMEFKEVKFDVTQITPDAPAGEWEVSIPRGKCKIQGTKEDNLPMIIVPIRLDKTEEEGEEFQKALGAVISTFLVFGGKNSVAERMSKVRIRQLCEAAGIDLDEVPKVIRSADDLAGFVNLLEGKRFTAWTRLTERKDTGETVTDLMFTPPKGTPISNRDEEEEEEEERPARKAGVKNGKRK